MASLDFLADSPPWFATAAQIVVTVLVVRLIQQLSDPNQPFWRFLEEGVCVMQTVIVSHELGVIRRSYGLVPYCIGTFLSCILYGRTFRRFVTTNPASAVHRFVYERQMTDLELLQHVLCQVVGAWLGFRYVYFMWASRYAENFHRQQLANLSPCTSSISVSLVNGIMIETAITFVHRLVAHNEKRLRYGEMWTGLAVVGCTLAGLPFTGGFFNPTLAFSMQYNCSGQNNVEFFAVYVFGPLAASYFVGLYGDAIWRQISSRNPLTTQ